MERLCHVIRPGELTLWPVVDILENSTSSTFNRECLLFFLCILGCRHGSLLWNWKTQDQGAAFYDKLDKGNGLCWNR
jgi:hypothetical protein